MRSIRETPKKSGGERSVLTESIMDWEKWLCARFRQFLISWSPFWKGMIRREDFAWQSAEMTRARAEAGKSIRSAA